MMIDLHTHLLPALDDGATDLDEALAMLALACEDGITVVVGTPHFDGADKHFPAKVRERWMALRQAAEASGVSADVLMGFELLLTPGLLNWGPELRSLGLNGGRYLLFELPMGFWPPYLHEVLFRIQSLGLRPILAHAERYEAIVRRPELAVDLVGRGVLLQVNGDSLLGSGGRRMERCAHILIKRGLVSFLASDAHSSQRRPPGLHEAMMVAGKLIGVDEAELLVQGNAEAVIQDVDLPPVPELRFQRQFHFLSGVWHSRERWKRD